MAHFEALFYQCVSFCVALKYLLAFSHTYSPNKHKNSVSTCQNGMFLALFMPRVNRGHDRGGCLLRWLPFL